MLTGELYVTVEDNALPEDSRDVHRVLLAESWNKDHCLVSNIIMNISKLNKQESQEKKMKDYFPSL